MDFISNQSPQIQEMLEKIGLKTIDELFQNIPSTLIVPKPQKDDGISEFEGLRFMEGLAAQNTFPKFENYLGAGAYEHHIPAIVGFICSKSEFLTSYTPYQPEASQGMLQAIFEFQSAICALTGMDVANASVYDGASACAEAVLMALRLKKGRNKILIASGLNPQYRKVIDFYLQGHDYLIETIPLNSQFQINQSELKDKIDESTAAILIQSPNFFGNLENVKEITTLGKNLGALTILCSNPLSYGIYASANELDVDIAVGDCQPFGLALNFGGPYAGYMACKQEFIRQLPGRIVGETIDTKGKRGFVLTLQAREQHIRREKATSNICTNQALAAFASLIAMLWYGKKGIPALALTNYQRASYLRQQLSEINGIKINLQTPIFNEFLVEFPGNKEGIFHYFRNQGIELGLFVQDYFSDLPLGHSFLVCVTETKSQEQLDRYVQVAKNWCQHVQNDI
ncbi:MAG: aminomethyl-transferring glycine dehydrogenase subunit GcvPA [Parachlamydiaceae bacterium]|nr:aminomethyl-transferring glycine dehydrogenase subunit GcvPA [Parachlamydiaceae bacterium]